MARYCRYVSSLLIALSDVFEWQASDAAVQRLQDASNVSAEERKVVMDLCTWHGKCLA